MDAKTVFIVPILKRAFDNFHAAPTIPLHGAEMAIVNDPYLTDQQKTMGQQILERAGILSGEGSSGLVSTGDLVRAGLGYLGGRYLVGAPASRLLGSILGLRPATRTTIQQAGGLLGALRATGLWS